MDGLTESETLDFHGTRDRERPLVDEDGLDAFLARELRVDRTDIRVNLSDLFFGNGIIDFANQRDFFFFLAGMDGTKANAIVQVLDVLEVVFDFIRIHVFAVAQDDGVLDAALHVVVSVFVDARDVAGREETFLVQRRIPTNAIDDFLVVDDGGFDPKLAGFRFRVCLFDFIDKVIEGFSDRAFHALLDAGVLFDGRNADLGHAKTVVEGESKPIDDGSGLWGQESASADAEADVLAKSLFLENLKDELGSARSSFFFRDFVGVVGDELRE